MDIIVRSIGFSISNALLGVIESKLRSLELLAPRLMRARVTLVRQSRSPSQRQFRASVQCEISGHDVYATESAPTVYEAVAMVAEKIRRRVRQRRKLRLTRRHGDVREDRAVRQYKLAQPHPTVRPGLTLRKEEAL